MCHATKGYASVQRSEGQTPLAPSGEREIMPTPAGIARLNQLRHYNLDRSRLEVIASHRCVTPQRGMRAFSEARGKRPWPRAASGRLCRHARFDGLFDLHTEIRRR